MKAKIHVTLKRGVLDPQGKAIAHALNALGFEEVRDVRQGKVLEIELDDDLPEALPSRHEVMSQRLEDMCQKLLANTVIEDYRIEWVG